MRTKQKIALFGSLRTLVVSSIFVALSIILGKYLAIPVGNIMRFSFESLPVLLAGFSFGPLVGMAVGIVADLFGSLLRGYDINLTVTLGAAVIGLGGGHTMELMMRFPQLAKRITCMPKPIADPFGGDEATYEACLAEIVAGVRDLLFAGDAQ